MCSEPVCSCTHSERGYYACCKISCLVRPNWPRGLLGITRWEAADLLSQICCSGGWFLNATGQNMLYILYILYIIYYMLNLKGLHRVILVCVCYVFCIANCTWSECWHGLVWCICTYIVNSVLLGTWRVGFSGWLWVCACVNIWAKASEAGWYIGLLFPTLFVLVVFKWDVQRLSLSLSLSFLSLGLEIIVSIGR